MSQASLTTRMKRASAHYLLRLQLNGAPFGGPVPGVTNYRGGELVLPLAPQQIKFDSRARTHLTPFANEQLADEHGVTPPEITVTGTTGHGAFGADTAQDGRAWQRDLEGLVRYYLEENHRRGTNREPLLQMSWHDTYRGEHWYVTPAAIPYGEQDASNPLRERYTLRLHALRPYGAPPTAPDPLPAAIAPSSHARVAASRTLDADEARDDFELAQQKAHFTRRALRRGEPDALDRIGEIRAAQSTDELRGVVRNHAD